MRDESGNDPYLVGTAKCTNETPKAIAVRLTGKLEGQWIPKSAVHDDSEVYARGHEGKLVVKQWFAEKEGL